MSNNIKKVLPLIKVGGVNYLIESSHLVTNPKNINVYSSRYRKVIKFGEVENSYLNECYEIVACEYPNKVEGLHQFKLGDEIEKLAECFMRDFLSNYTGLWKTKRQQVKEAFKEGYKANKALYTGRDIQLAYIEGRKDCHLDDYFEKHSKEYLQSLNKSKEIESVEVEMTDELYFLDENTSVPKLDENGLLIINKINYTNE